MLQQSRNSQVVTPTADIIKGGANTHVGVFSQSYQYCFGNDERNTLCPMWLPDNLDLLLGTTRLTVEATRSELTEEPCAKRLLSAMFANTGVRKTRVC